MSYKNNNQWIDSRSIELSDEVNTENFYFVFGDYMSNLKYKMLKETSIRQGIEGRYSISYREYKVVYFVCLKNDAFMIIDCHRLSIAEAVFNMYR